METPAERQSDVVRIGGERYHLRDWEEGEITAYIEYRTHDIEEAREDIATATAILGERNPTELRQEAFGEHPEPLDL